MSPRRLTAPCGGGRPRPPPLPFALPFAFALSFAFTISGCGGTLHSAVPEVRPFGEDLVALLPSGADALFDIDVGQLDDWPESRRLLGLLPQAAAIHIAHLGFDPLRDVEAAALELTDLGSDHPESTLVLRGDFDLAAARAQLSTAGDVHDSQYRGITVSEGPNGALARLGPRVAVFGPSVAVRRAIDCARMQGDSVRSSAVDGPLRDALGHAPTGRYNRPAIEAALIPSALIADQLRKDGLPGDDLAWVAASFAVGDGFDLGVVMGAPGRAEADSTVVRARKRVAALERHAIVRLLGLQPFLEPMIFKAHENEVHFAYRLPETQVDALIERIRSLGTMVQRKTGGS